MQKKDNSLLSRDFLYECILTLKSKKDCASFFEDLCTIQELNSIAQRLEVARLLKQGKTYTTIAAETGSSTATISRVNRSLSYGTGGYDLAFGKLKEKDNNE